MSPCIKWADHITCPLRLYVCMEWEAKLEKVKGRLGAGEAGITGFWDNLLVQRSKRGGVRIFFKREGFHPKMESLRG